MSMAEQLSKHLT